MAANTANHRRLQPVRATELPTAPNPSASPNASLGQPEPVRAPRPGSKPEEGAAERSDWFALGKAVVITFVVIAVLGTLLTR